MLILLSIPPPLFDPTTLPSRARHYTIGLHFAFTAFTGESKPLRKSLNGEGG